MAKGNRVGIKGRNGRKMRQREEDSEESDEEYKVTEDEECDESDECYSFDGDESEEIFADFEPSKRVSRSRNKRRSSAGRKENESIKPRKRRRVLYTEDDDNDAEEVGDDDAEFIPLDRKIKQFKKPTRKKIVSDTDVNEDEDIDDDYAECMSLGRKSNQLTKPVEKKKFSDTEVYDDDDDDDDYNEEEDSPAFVSSSRKRNHKKKPREKKRDLYANENKNEDEDDDDDDGDGDGGDEDEDDEFRFISRKGSQKKDHREKRKISYTEDDEDEDVYEFMSTSGKRNQVMEPREKSTVSYKEDNEEEDDEKDEEFKLSESDFVDDEDEDTPKMKKNDKVTKSRPHKKTVPGGWITVKKSDIKKSIRAKQRNNRTGRKLGRVRNKNQVEKRSKKISKRRKHSSIPESDSEFVSSASSDHEYTISEDEREQMREARVYCANLRAKIRSSSCGNQLESPCEQRKYPIRKGKEKIEEMKDEAGKQVCGICLSEEGKRTVQGVLNCCRHYFCFSCIMEWSKVESRCPLCKQRFATITKAAKSDTAFDLRTVVIPVPECDQVYQPSEEEVRGYLDPYESVICSECHNGGDDALMLLCDVCDSSAHTFCVGLGQEVPDGNWYCEGCRPTVLFGSLNSQQPIPPTTSDRRLSSNASELSSPLAGGFDLNELYVPETPLTQQTREPRHPVGEFNPAPNGTGATTLRDRRRIRQHIHHRLINNNHSNNNNTRTLASSSSSSSGIRLFGSQLDQTITSPERTADPRASFIGREDHIIRSARANRFGVQVQNSSFPFFDESLQDEHGQLGMGFDSSFGYAQLRPCCNRSSVGSDACREVIGPSRTSQGGLHAP